MHVWEHHIWVWYMHICASPRWEEDARCLPHSLESGSFNEPGSRLAACKSQWSGCLHPLVLGFAGANLANPASHVGSKLRLSTYVASALTQRRLSNLRKQHLNDHWCNSSPTSIDITVVSSSWEGSRLWYIHSVVNMEKCILNSRMLNTNETLEVVHRR